MKLEQIDKPIFANITGNPFVDSGMWALTGLVDSDKKKKKTPQDLTVKDLERGLDIITRLYIEDGWSKNLYSIFTSNCLLLNPANKKNDRTKKYQKYMISLIEEINQNPLSKQGSCIGCGRRESSSRIPNTNVPLTGSGKYRNFFSYLAEGADYCCACLFVIQFLPLALYSAKNLLMIHSKDTRILRRWNKKLSTYVLAQFVNRQYDGCYTTITKNPTNALFTIILDIINYLESKQIMQNPSIQFYYFTNYSQKPELELYPFPNPVFNFLNKIVKSQRTMEWNEIVRRGYRNVNWAKITEEKEYVNKHNSVFHSLLAEKTIIRWFIDKSNRIALGGWELLFLYLSEVRKMNTKRIEILKIVGDKIAKYLQETNNFSRLNKLERSDTYRELRNQLRFVIKDRIKLGYEDPLYSLDEYVQQLFPDYQLWRETHDLLLFRIYEKSHTWLVEQAKKEENKNLMEDKE